MHGPVWLASAGLSFQLVAVELKAGLVAAAQAAGTGPWTFGMLRDGGVGLFADAYGHINGF